MTNDELRDELIALAKRYALSVMEIDYMARIIAQADYDPLPAAQWGEPFEFAPCKMSVFGDPYDFNCINSLVPKPDAQVDLTQAWKESLDDLRAVNSLFQKHGPGSALKLSLEQSWKLLLNQRDWTHFWSLRHWDARVRTVSARDLPVYDAVMKRTADWADAKLKKHNVAFLKGTDE
jgi:hypothetical protein